MNARAAPQFTLPAHWYTSTDQFQREREQLLASHWSLAGHVSELARPGDYISLQVGPYPLFAVRSSTSEIVARYNVCRHRAGPLVSGHGHCEQLACRYHGWTYDLDGRLLSAPDFGEHSALESPLRLKSAGLMQWAGLLLLHPDGRAPADRALDHMGRELALDFSQYRHDDTRTYQLDCNWKCYVDNYLEGYHLDAVHPGLSRVLDAGGYRTQLHDGWSLQSSPIAGTPDAALYAYRFPDLMFNMLPDRLQTNRVIALAADRCEVIFDYYYAPGISAQARSADQASAHQTQLEDVAICESVQRNLASGAYQRGPLSPRWETGVGHFHQMLREIFEDSG